MYTLLWDTTWCIFDYGCLETCLTLQICRSPHSLPLCLRLNLNTPPVDACDALSLPRIMPVVIWLAVPEHASVWQNCACVQDFLLKFFPEVLEHVNEPSKRSIPDRSQLLHVYFAPVIFVRRLMCFKILSDSSASITLSMNTMGDLPADIAAQFTICSSWTSAPARDLY